MSNDDLFQKVKDLKLPMGKYALFGTAVLGVRGLKDCRDIDIIVTDDLWNDCKNEGWKTGEAVEGNQCLLSGRIEIWKTWGPGQWNIRQLIDEAEIIDGLSFVKLERVLEWKKIRAWEKDLKDIEIIERFLQAQK